MFFLEFVSCYSIQLQKIFQPEVQVRISHPLTLGGDQESGNTVPLILVGTKQNEVPVAKRSEVSERSRRMAEEIGAVYINLDALDSKVMNPGSSVKIGNLY